MKIPGPVKKALFEATVNGSRLGVEAYYQALVKHYPHSTSTLLTLEREYKTILDNINSINVDEYIDKL